MTPLETGGQYCDACKQPPPRPVDAPTPTETTETGECVDCGRQVEPGGVCPCSIVIARSDVHFGGFFVRAAAFCADWLILGAIGSVVALASNSLWTAAFVMIGIGLVSSVGFWLADGATPGEMLFRLKVRMVNGQAVEPVAAVVRYFASLASGLLLGAGFLMMLFNEEKRGLHDMISNTIVIVDADR